MLDYEQCIYAINLQTLFILPINTCVCLYVTVVTCNYLPNKPL